MQYIKNYNLRKTEEYKNLSEIAVRVFNLLLDRYSLSEKNNRADEDGIYVQYSQIEMAWDLDRSDRHIRNGLAELKKVGLIKKVVRLYKRKSNKIYLELPTSLTPIKNPFTEAKKKAKKIIKKTVENVDAVIKHEDKELVCHPVVESEISQQLGHKLTNIQKNKINKIKNLKTLTDEDIKQCVKTTVEKTTSPKMESKINFLITTLTNFRPKTQYNKVIRQEQVPDWLKENNESWKNINNQETKVKKISHEDAQKVERMKFLQKQLLQQKG